MSANAPAVQALGLGRSFGQNHAVDGVDLSIPAGSIFGLLGPDGAGKSTLIRMLATVLAPDTGDAMIFGKSVTRSPGQVTPRIGYMSQNFSMYPTSASLRTSTSSQPFVGSVEPSAGAGPPSSCQRWAWPSSPTGRPK